MSETTIAMEPTTETTNIRKTRTRKPSPPHITALKAAVSKALKAEWLLQRSIDSQIKLVMDGQARIARQTYDAREAWLTVHDRSADCANARLS